MDHINGADALWAFRLQRHICFLKRSAGKTKEKCFKYHDSKNRNEVTAGGGVGGWRWRGGHLELQARATEKKKKLPEDL